MFWSGAFITGARSFHGVGEWAAASAGLASLWATMLGATRRLDAKQLARYGAQEEYARYFAQTGALAPRFLSPQPLLLRLLSGVTPRGPKAAGAA